MVRVRFAPSPTGPMSLGNARTALFNWLYARRYKGKFLLRIEDTDRERSKTEFEKNILKTLEWLGINWDEAPIKQSERIEIYEKYLKILVEQGYAYHCFCSVEELEADRQAQLSQGLAPKYSGKCRNITKEEVEQKLNRGEKPVIRFKVTPGEISFEDIIRGKIKFDPELTGDFVIAKSFQKPLYNFAVVIDDYKMDITHVIRGEDHISNTPKQIAIQRALEMPTPKYAHLPLILGPGGKKLSKRLLKTSLMDYKKEGYLSEALFNFLLLLGWHPKEDKEVISKEEAIQTFSLQRIQKSGAVYNQDKLDWYNGYYIRNSNTDSLLKLIEPFIPERWVKNKELLKKALGIEKERMKFLTDFKELADFFFELPNYEPNLLIWKNQKEFSINNLNKILYAIEKFPEREFNKKNLNDLLEDMSREGSRGGVYWPLRVALSGKKTSPGALEIAVIIGKQETIDRVKIGLEKAKMLGSN